MGTVLVNLRDWYIKLEEVTLGRDSKRSLKRRDISVMVSHLLSSVNFTKIENLSA